MKYSKKILILPVLFLFMGCHAMHTAVTKGDLEVETKMSETIFLDPVAPKDQVVFVQVRNTSNNPGFDNMASQIKTNIQQKGYRITDDPTKAHYILQAMFYMPINPMMLTWIKQCLEDLVRVLPAVF